MSPAPPLATTSPLVLRFGAFGDMVLLAPTLRALSARHGAPCDLVALGSWTEPVLGRLPEVGSIRLVRSRRGPYWVNPSQWDLVKWLRARPEGPVYVAEMREKTHWLLQRAGIPTERIHAVRDLAPLPREHIADNTLRLAGVAVSGRADFAPLPLSEWELADCARWLDARGLGNSPLVLIQPGNKRTTRRFRWSLRNVKYWPEERWVEVIRGVLARMPTARLVICGSAPERGLAEDIALRCQDRRVIAAAGELPIPRLLALQARAHSMISVDTGPAHSAAMMGCPLTVLFAKPWAHYYRPRSAGSAVEVLEPAQGEPAPGMLSITPGRVLQAWRKMQETPMPMAPAQRAA